MDKKRIFNYLDGLEALGVKEFEGVKEFLLGELIVESEDEVNAIIKEWKEEKQND